MIISNVAIAQANDAINQRNDDEKRRERARMGNNRCDGADP